MLHSVLRTGLPIRLNSELQRVLKWNLYRSKTLVNKSSVLQGLTPSSATQNLSEWLVPRCLPKTAWPTGQDESRSAVERNVPRQRFPYHRCSSFIPPDRPDCRLLEHRQRLRTAPTFGSSRPVNKSVYHQPPS